MITSGYLPRLNRVVQHVVGNAPDEWTILLLVVESTVFFALVKFVKAPRPFAAEMMHVSVGWRSGVALDG